MFILLFFTYFESKNINQQMNQNIDSKCINNLKSFIISNIIKKLIADETQVFIVTVLLWRMVLSILLRAVISQTKE